MLLLLLRSQLTGSCRNLPQVRAITNLRISNCISVAMLCWNLELFRRLMNPFLLISYFVLSLDLAGKNILILIMKEQDSWMSATERSATQRRAVGISQCLICAVLKGCLTLLGLKRYQINRNSPCEQQISVILQGSEKIEGCGQMVEMIGGLRSRIHRPKSDLPLGF